MTEPKKADNRLFSLANLLSPTVKAALIGAAAALVVNWWIAPAQNRAQKLADRQYDVLAEVAQLNADYYQAVWNVYFAIVGNEEASARRSYREQVQRASSAAQGMKVKLYVLFKDRTIVDDWQGLMQTYHDAYYPLGRSQDVSESDLNERLRPAEGALDSIVRKMRHEIDL